MQQNNVRAHLMIITMIAMWGRHPRLRGSPDPPSHELG
jgi:hypothetical protein